MSAGEASASQDTPTPLPVLPPRLRAQGSLLARSMTAALFLFLLALGLRLLAQESSCLFLLEDTVGYGDSSVMCSVRRFQQSGVIYDDAPTLYSPAVYLVYSAPGRFTGANPFLGPRLLALCAFLLCVAVTASLVRTLIPVASAWIWGLLLLGSLSCLREWSILLRGDFFAIFFSLLAVRLLPLRFRWAVVAAGLSAGLATQFKFTYLAACVAGTLWLLLQRRLKDAAWFAAAGAVTSVGVYLLIWLREPTMFAHLAAFGTGIPEYAGWWALLYRVVSEPLIFLALTAIPAVVRFASWRWRLIGIYAAVSFTIALMTSVQSGANTNYFFEGLFVLIPFAVLGVFRLTIWSRRSRSGALGLLALLFVQFLIPAAADLYSAIASVKTPAQIASRNLAFQALESLIAARHTFTTVPRFALADPASALTEPYGFSMLVRMGKLDPSPLLHRLASQEFELVVTSSTIQSWRGIPHIAPELHRAIAKAYEPVWICSRYVIQVPRGRPRDTTLGVALLRVGCVPLAAGIER
jgi:hypothetical protein